MKNWDFQLLLTGQTLAAVGAAMTSLAMSLLAYDLSQNAATAALVLTGNLIGYLLASLPAGALVDRLNRKLIMILAPLTQALSLASIPIALFLGALTLPHMWIAGFVIGTMNAFYEPAEQSAIKRIVRPEELGTAVTVDQARASFGAVAGPPLAGLAYAFARWLPFGCEALVRLIVALLSANLRTDLRPEPASTKTTMKQLVVDITEGLKFVVQHKTLRIICLLAALINLGFQTVMVAVVLGMRADGVSAQMIGLVPTCMGVGGLLGALASTPIVAKVRLGVLVPGGFLVTSLVAAGLAFAHQPFAIMAVLTCLTLVLPSLNAGITTVLMHDTPDHVMGRVTSTLGTATVGLIPVGAILGGTLLEYAGRPWAIGAGALITAVAAAICFGSSTIRGLPRAAQMSPEPAGKEFVK